MQKETRHNPTASLGGWGKGKAWFGRPFQGVTCNLEAGASLQESWKLSRGYWKSFCFFILGPCPLPCWEEGSFASPSGFPFRTTGKSGNPERRVCFCVFRRPHLEAGLEMGLRMGQVLSHQGTQVLVLGSINQGPCWGYPILTHTQMAVAQINVPKWHLGKWNQRLKPA